MRSLLLTPSPDRSGHVGLAQAPSSPLRLWGLLVRARFIPTFSKPTTDLDVPRIYWRGSTDSRSWYRRGWIVGMSVVGGGPTPRAADSARDQAVQNATRSPSPQASTLNLHASYDAPKWRDAVAQHRKQQLSDLNARHLASATRLPRRSPRLSPAPSGVTTSCDGTARVAPRA